MDEPLLCRQNSPGSTQITKKSEHPFLRVFSPRSRHGAGSAEFDPWRLSSSQPASSQLSTSPLFPIPGVGSDQSWRSGSFGSSLPAENGAISRSFSNEASIGRNQDGLGHIPEEAAAIKEPQFSNFSPEWDLEAPTDMNGGDERYAQAHACQNSEEAQTYDTDGVAEDQNWIPRVSGFLLSSIPEVFHHLSSAPEHDYFGCRACEPDQEDEDQHSELDIDSNNADSEFTISPALREVSSVPDLRGVDGEEQKLLRGGSLERKSNDNSSRNGSWKRRSMHRAKTAPMLSELSKCRKKKVEPEAKLKGSSSSRPQAVSSIVWQAFIGLCIYLAVGVAVFTWKKDEFSGAETVTVVDALYFCIVTMCTIGYGDIAPVSPTAKLLACLLMFVGFGFIEALLSGMLTFVLDRQEHLLLTVVEDGHHERAKNYFMNSKKGRMRIRMKVALAVFTVLMTIIVGVLFLHLFEGLKWIDSLYVTCISITTVGYGDYSFTTTWGRLFAAVWLLLSTLGVARAFLFLAEARVHSRHRHLAKKILERRMTTDDLLAMDLDNDGHISKSEFVVYKLREMGKIDQRDVVEICNQFDFLDSIDAGKITLGQLLDADG